MSERTCALCGATYDPWTAGGLYYCRSCIAALDSGGEEEDRPKEPRHGWFFDTYDD